MANWTTNILEIYGEKAEIGRFRGAITKRSGDRIEYDLNGLVPPGPQGPLKAWGTSSGAFDVEIRKPNDRPLEVVFESGNVPPIKLVQQISILFPSLVFALRFLDECFCYVGWAVCAHGTLLEGRLNKDVYRAGDRRFDRAAWEAEQLDPEATLIDGFEAVDWAERFFEALNVVPRPVAEELGLSAEFAAHEKLAARVEDLSPEYEAVQTRLGDRARSLEEFTESASLLEAHAECRSAVERVLEAQQAAQTEVL